MVRALRRIDSVRIHAFSWLALALAGTIVPVRAAPLSPAQQVPPETVRPSPMPVGTAPERWRFERRLDLLREALTLAFVDAWLPGKARGVALTRRYHSRSERQAGVFGPGWSAGYEVRLRPGADPRVLEILEVDGTITAYHRSEDATWRPLLGAPLTPHRLVARTEGGYERRWEAGWLERFDRLGRLVAIEGQGATIALVYPDPITPLPRALVSSEGLWLSLEHARGRLVRVRDPLGRTVRYRYDDAGRLRAIEDPLGRLSRFSYDRHDRLTRLTLPGGATVEIHYDAEGRPQTVDGPDARRLTLRWDRTQDPPSRTLAIDVDGTLCRTVRLELSGKSGSALPALRLVERSGQGRETAVTLWDPDTSDQHDQDLKSASQRIADWKRTDSWPQTIARLGPAALLEAAPVIARDAAGRPTRIGASQAAEGLVWDAGDRLIARIPPGAEPERFRHDARDRLVSVARGATRTAELSYGALGRLTRVQDARTGAWRFRYDDHSRLRLVRGPKGFARTFEYDAGGRLEAVRDGSGHLLYERTSPPTGTASVRVRRHDAAGRLVERIERTGKAVRYRYDEATRSVRARHSDGLEQVFTFDEAGGVVVTQRSRNGLRSTLRFDSEGRLTSLAAGDQQLEAHYDHAGRLSTLTDERGDEERWRYDERGRPLTYTLNGVVSRRWRYDEQGRLRTYEEDDRRLDFDWLPDGGLRLEVEEPNGLRRALRFDSEGRLLTERRGDGATLQVLYDETGRVRAILGPDMALEIRERAGGERRITLRTGAKVRTLAAAQPDAKTRVLRDGAGEAFVWRRLPGGGVHFEHPQLGRWEQTTSPSGASLATPLGLQRLERDALGRLRAFSDPLLGTLTFEAPSADRLEAVRADGSRYALRFDPLGTLREIAAPLGHRQRLSVHGNETRFTDPLGGLWRRIVEKGGRRIRKRSPLGHEEIYEADASSRLVRWRRPVEGQHVRWRFDAENERLSIEYGAGRSLVIEHRRKLGETRFDGPDAPFTLRYDALARPRAVLSPGLPRIRYGYDEDGRLAEIRWAKTCWRYRFDALGRLVGVHVDADTALTWTRDALGRPLEWRLPGGALVRYRYDGARPLGFEVLDPEGKVSYHERYRFDVLGRLVELEDPDGVHRFDYDALDRLVLARWANGTEERWRYDAAGNVIEDPSGRRYRYDADQRLLTRGANKFMHDAAGRLVGLPDGTTLRFDSADRLLEAHTAGATLLRFGYDAWGRIAWRERNGRRTFWLWSGPHRIAELRDADTIERSYLPGQEPGRWLGVKTEAGWRWAIRTLNGSITALLDEHGRLVARLRPGVYGGPRPGHTPSGLGFESFAAGIPEPELGGIWFGHRLYLPELHRFAQPDPLGPDLLGALYTYARANPLVLVDRSGLRAQSVLEIPRFRWWTRYLPTKIERREREAVVRGLFNELERLARTEPGAAGEIAKATLHALRSESSRKGGATVWVRPWERVGAKAIPSTYGAYQPLGGVDHPVIRLYLGPQKGDAHELLKTLVHETQHLVQHRAPSVRRTGWTKRHEFEAFYREWQIDGMLFGKRTDLKSVIGHVETAYAHLPGSITPEIVADEIRRWSPTLNQLPRARALPELAAKYRRLGVEEVRLAPIEQVAEGVHRQLEALRRVRREQATLSMLARTATPMSPEPLALRSRVPPLFSRALSTAGESLRRFEPALSRALRGAGRLGKITLHIGSKLLEPGLNALALYDAYALLTELGDATRAFVREWLEQSGLNDLAARLEPDADEPLAAARAAWLRQRFLELGGAGQRRRKREPVIARPLLERAMGKNGGGWAGLIHARARDDARWRRRGGIVGALERVGATLRASGAIRAPGSAPPTAQPHTVTQTASTSATATWIDDVLRYEREEAKRRRRALERALRRPRWTPPPRDRSRQAGNDDEDRFLVAPPEPAQPKTGLLSKVTGFFRGLFGGSKRSSNQGTGSDPSIPRRIYHSVNPYALAADALDRALGPVLDR